MSKSVSEVEEILREIRLRVQHENLASTQIARKAEEKSPLELESGANLETDRIAVPLDLAHLEARLLTIERTRNNLPPIVSRRSGLVARTELFVKRQIKRMTKWFTHDQLIYNTAVYETLVELQKMQVSCAQQLASCLQEQARLREYLAELAEEQKSGAAAEIDELRSELQERFGQLADQQTVIYKNLLIQANETAAVTDKSRHSLEERLTALEKGKSTS